MEDNMWIVFALMGAGLSAVVASQKGRNALGWAALGFLFPLISVIAIFCVKSLLPQPQVQMQMQPAMPPAVPANWPPR